MRGRARNLGVERRQIAKAFHLLKAGKTKEAVKRLEAVAPCVLQLDEILKDVIGERGPKRGGGAVTRCLASRTRIPCPRHEPKAHRSR
jgi:hypothetical protein